MDTSILELDMFKKITSLLLHFIAIVLCLLLNCGENKTYQEKHNNENESNRGESAKTYQIREKWKCPIVISPGKGMGALYVGMSISDLMKLGTRIGEESKMNDKTPSSETQYYWVDAEYSVRVEHGIVESISISPQKAPENCIEIRGKKIPHKDIVESKVWLLYVESLIKYYERVVGYFDECKKQNGIYSGGEKRECENGGVIISVNPHLVEITVK
jgi:hypothetical protein